MVGVRGDFGKLDALGERLKGLGRNAFRARVMRDMALESRDLIHQSFRNSRSPNGVKWRALKRRSGMPLMDTRRLYNSFVAVSGPRHFRVDTRVIYAARQNYGWPPGRLNHPPPRPFLPDARRRLPREWFGRLSGIAREHVKRQMGRR